MKGRIRTLADPLQRLVHALGPDALHDDKKLFRRLNQAVAKAREPHRLHGHRVQEMFRQLVASLGAFRLIKDEDAGQVISRGAAIAVPDFRVVLPDDSLWLIEVKNHHAPPDRPFTANVTYVDRLTRYATIQRCELRLAIFWSRVNTWTLIRPQALTRNGIKCRIDLPTAFTANEMVLLGDKWLAAAHPISWRLRVDVEKVPGRDGLHRFTIRGSSLRCRGQILNEVLERELAYLFMFYGNWETYGWRFVWTESGRGYLELGIEPQAEALEANEDAGDGLQYVATLSGIFSAYYRQVASGVKPKRTQRRFRPAMLGKLLTKGFRCPSLPLAVVTMLPKGFEGPVPAWLR